jgi:cation/acetate symporter
MAITHSSRVANPRIAIYYGIVLSLIVGFFLLALMFEQLGAGSRNLGLTILAGPLLLYLAIAGCTIASEPAEFFASGRRVTAIVNGAVLGVASVGGIGFACFAGSFMHMGVDALALTTGVIAGLVLMAVLIVPFLRKAGDYTIPGFLGRRFESNAVRLVAAALAFIPAALMLGAEIKIAATASGWLAGQSQRTMLVVIASLMALIVIAGGVRAVTWSSAAKAIVALLALSVPATLVALALTGLPLPQMSQGNVLRQLARLELARGVPAIAPDLWVFDLPAADAEPLERRFLQMYGSTSGLTFALSMFTVMAGVAASPILLARCGTTHSIYAARKSMAWAVVVAGFAVLTISASAVFLRFLMVDQVVGQTPDNLPQWFSTLQALGLAKIEGPARVIGLSNISFLRDSTLFAMSIAAALPASLVYLSLAGILAAALIVVAGGMGTLGAIISEDVIGHDVSSSLRGARIATVLAGATGFIVASLPGDPLRLAYWAFTLTGATLFPTLVLAIWWKRMTKWGAIAGLITGFVTAAAILAIAEFRQIEIGVVIAAPLCGVLAAALTIIISQITHAPGRHVLEMVRDLRVPGGETLYDRHVRLARLKSRKTP